MHHSDFIAILANLYKPKTYVELGLYEGETMSKVLPYIGNGYGVDMISKPALENLKSFSKLKIIYTTTNKFFESFNDGIDMAFIDADHCYDSVVVDFENVYNRLNPGGIIILHDTDPESNHLINPGYCGDSYKMVNYLESRSDLNCTTFPLTEAGLTIVTKKNDTRTSRRGYISQ
jgi:predicted O-methyltransferase YrrM